MVIDFGYVISAIVPAILLLIFGMDHLEPIWRLSCGLGVVFPLSVLYCKLFIVISKVEPLRHMADNVSSVRLKMINSTRYRKESLKRNVPYLLILKRYWRRILATAGIWFFYDFLLPSWYVPHT